MLHCKTTAYMYTYINNKSAFIM